MTIIMENMRRNSKTQGIIKRGGNFHLHGQAIPNLDKQNVRSKIIWELFRMYASPKIYVFFIIQMK
jgi:hypothetical protein